MSAHEVSVHLYMLGLLKCQRPPGLFVQRIALLNGVHEILKDLSALDIAIPGQNVI